MNAEWVFLEAKESKCSWFKGNSNRCFQIKIRCLSGNLENLFKNFRNFSGRKLSMDEGSSLDPFKLVCIVSLNEFEEEDLLFLAV